MRRGRARARAAAGRRRPRRIRAAPKTMSRPTVYATRFTACGRLGGTSVRVDADRPEIEAEPLLEERSAAAGRVARRSTTAPRARSAARPPRPGRRRVRCRASRLALHASHSPSGPGAPPHAHAAGGGHPQGSRSATRSCLTRSSAGDRRGTGPTSTSRPGALLVAALERHGRAGACVTASCAPAARRPVRRALPTPRPPSSPRRATSLAGRPSGTTRTPILKPRRLDCRTQRNGPSSPWIRMASTGGVVKRRRRPAALDPRRGADAFAMPAAQRRDGVEDVDAAGVADEDRVAVAVVERRHERVDDVAGDHHLVRRLALADGPPSDTPTWMPWTASSTRLSRIWIVPARAPPTTMPWPTASSSVADERDRRSAPTSAASRSAGRVDGAAAPRRRAPSRAPRRCPWLARELRGERRRSSFSRLRADEDVQRLRPRGPPRRWCLRSLRARDGGGRSASAGCAPTSSPSAAAGRAAAGPVAARSGCPSTTARSTSTSRTPVCHGPTSSRFRSMPDPVGDRGPPPERTVTQVCDAPGRRRRDTTSEQSATSARVEADHRQRAVELRVAGPPGLPPSIRTWRISISAEFVDDERGLGLRRAQDRGGPAPVTTIRWRAFSVTAASRSA